MADSNSQKNKGNAQGSEPQGEEENTDFTFSDIPVLGKGGGGKKADFSFETFEAKTTGGAKQIDRQKDKLDSFTVMLKESPVVEDPRHDADDNRVSLGWRLRRLTKQIRRRKTLVISVFSAALILAAAVVGLMFLNTYLAEKRKASPAPTAKRGPAAVQQDNRALEEAMRLISQADSAYSSGGYRDALEKYRSALASTSKERAAAIHVKMAGCLRASGAVSEALAEYSAAIDCGLTDSSPIISMAQSLMKAQDNSGAVALLEKAAAAFPTDKKLVLLLADNCGRLNDHQKAADWFAKVGKADLSFEQMNAYANALLKCDKKSEASDMLAYAAERFDNLESYLRAVELAEGADDKIRILAKAANSLITSKDKSAAVLEMVGVLNSSGKKSEALDKFKTLSPADLPPERMLSYVSMYVIASADDPGLKGSMKENMLELANLRKADIAFNTALQDVLLSSNQGDVAVAMYTELCKSDSENPLRNFMLARCLGPGSPEAKNYCIKALERKPEFPEALAYLGLIFARERNWTDAVETYAKSAKMNPDDKEPRRLTAIAKLRMGGGSGAVAEYEKYLETHKFPKDKSLLEVFNVALLLPKPGKADQCLKAMASNVDEVTQKTLKLSEIRRKAVFSRLDDRDFTGYCPVEARMYQILHLLSCGRFKEIASVPVEETPDFWKTFVAWRHGLGGDFTKNAEVMYDKYKDRPDPVFGHLRRSLAWQGLPG